MVQLRSASEDHLTKYVVVGDVFPIQGVEGAGLVKSEAKRILAMIGEDPPDRALKLILFTSHCCLQLARALVVAAGPENIALGLRRASVTKTTASARERCVLTTAVVAHAATMVSFLYLETVEPALLTHGGMQITNWLKILAVCTAEPETRRFPSSLARTLSSEEVASLLVNCEFLNSIASIAKTEVDAPKLYVELQKRVTQIDDEMELWALNYDHIFLPNS